MGEQTKGTESSEPSPRSRVDATTRDDEGPEPLSSVPRTIGRFVVLRRIGSGGMGTVYSAYDEALGRRVAIKLLRRGRRPGSRRRARMRREAQAMARVSHTNVVQVYEVGEHEGQTFIAMEYVEGQTVEQWLTRTKPSREAILDAYRQAGAGLAGAHDAGVLHRDFKPGNLLIDDTGRVRVTDFGLAAWLRQAEGAITGDHPVTDPGTLVEAPARLTHAGTLVGTPAFMAPEQFRGHELDARADQFAFCVALYEALVGAHPFGDDTAELREAVVQGRVRDHAAVRALPAYLRAALRRGLARRPERRFPDMKALLSALEPPRPPPWPRLVLGGALLLVVVGGTLMLARGSGPAAPEACRGVDQAATRVWNEGRQAQAAAALERSGHPLATPTWSRVRERIDGHVQGWSQARQRVCEATHVHGVQSPALLDQRMACLDLRLEAVAGLLDAFEDADADTVLHAVEAASGLPEVAPCEQVGAPVEATAEPASAEVVELQRRLLALQAELDLGRSAEIVDALAKLHTEAMAYRRPRIAVEAAVLRGRALRAAGRVQEAQADFEAALWAALEVGHDHAAVEAAIEHAQLVGFTLVDRERGMAGLERARALLARAGTPERLELELRMTEATVLGRHGQHQAAGEASAQALALAQQMHGRHHVAYARALGVAGAVALWSDRLDDAAKIFEEAAELDAALYDPEHVAVASALSNHAIAMASRGDLEAARALFERSLEIRRVALGDDHLEVADALLNSVGVLMDPSSLPLALERIDEARAIYVAALGEAAAKVTDADLARGLVLEAMEREGEAEQVYRRVLDRLHAGTGAASDRFTPAQKLGRLLARTGRPEQAVPLLEEALAASAERLEALGLEPDDSSEHRALADELRAAREVAGQLSPRDR